MAMAMTVRPGVFETGSVRQSSSQLSPRRGSKRWGLRRTRRLGERHCMVGGTQGGDGGEVLPVGVMIEVEGGVVDTHLTLHRVAFNEAFRACGLHSNWETATYKDLLHAAGAKGGTAEAMLESWFQMSGLPSASAAAKLNIDGVENELVLGNSELRAHLIFKGILLQKREAYLKLVQEGAFRLKDGLTQFLDDALLSGHLGSGTAEQTEEVGQPRICFVMTDDQDDELLAAFEEAIKEKLGPMRSRLVQFFRSDADDWGIDGSGNDDDSSDTEKTMEEMIRRYKVRMASDVTSSLNNVVLSLPDAPKLTPQKIGAMAALGIRVPTTRSIFIASCASSVRAARGAGCAAVVALRGGTTQGAQFGGALSYNGYGSGDGLKWRRLMATTGLQ